MAEKKEAGGNPSHAAKRAAPRRKTPRKAKAGTSGLDALACKIQESDPALEKLKERIEAEGGFVVGAYKDPLGGQPLAIAVVPIDKVEPTPFQRDLSDAHHKRLAEVIHKTARFLDPLIAITAPLPAEGGVGGFWTPNGRHRLEAMRRLGAKAITILATPAREVAWQILALNTEKAHNLKERALEVVRIYRGLYDEDSSRPESSFAFYLEDPSLVTIGMIYEKNPRFAGGAYHPVLRRVQSFTDDSLKVAIKHHEKIADLTSEVETIVASVIEKLKARGLVSPYLRSFVVARINPLRWIKSDTLPTAEEVLKTMRERAAKFNVDKVNPNDLARAGGAPDEPTS